MAKVSKNQRTDLAAAAAASQGRGSIFRFEKPECPYCGALSRYKNKPSRGTSNRVRECENNHVFTHKDCAPARRRNMDRKVGRLTVEAASRKLAGTAR